MLNKHLDIALDIALANKHLDIALDIALAADKFHHGDFALKTHFLLIL